MFKEKWKGWQKCTDFQTSLKSLNLWPRKFAQDSTELALTIASVAMVSRLTFRPMGPLKQEGKSWSWTSQFQILRRQCWPSRFWRSHGHMVSLCFVDVQPVISSIYISWAWNHQVKMQDSSEDWIFFAAGLVEQPRTRRGVSARHVSLWTWESGGTVGRSAWKKSLDFEIQKMMPAMLWRIDLFTSFFWNYVGTTTKTSCLNHKRPLNHLRFSESQELHQLTSLCVVKKFASCLNRKVLPVSVWKQST